MAIVSLNERLRLMETEIAELKEQNTILMS